MTDTPQTPSTSQPVTTSHTLRELVEDRIGQRWADWARRHPHLAEVLDRARLVDTTVAALREDPAFAQAMGAAALDHATLRRAADVLDHVDRLVRRALAF